MLIFVAVVFLVVMFALVILLFPRSDALLRQQGEYQAALRYEVAAMRATSDKVAARLSREEVIRGDSNAAP